MFLIHCPHCGEDREEEEFHAAGEAHLPRPPDPDNCSDVEWGEYLYFRKNPRGLHRELWVHAAGCRQFFNIARNTHTYEIYGSYKVGECLDVELDQAEHNNMKLPNIPSSNPQQGERQTSSKPSADSTGSKP